MAESTRPTPTQGSTRDRSSIDDTAARALGGDLDPTIALAAHVAAVRELFEEAGVLLADVAGHGDGADGRPVDPGPSLGLARSALVGGETSLRAIAAELDLRLRTDLLVPLSRWVTPPTLPSPVRCPVLRG